jgi:hypothetical protein
MRSALLQSRPPVELGKVELHGERSTVQPKWFTTAVAETVFTVRGTVKKIAASLGVSEQLVYRHADLNDPLPKPLKAWWIPTFVRESGSIAILQTLAAECGCAVFRLPSRDQASGALARDVATAVKRFGAFLETHGETFADGRVDAHEVRPVLNQIDDLMATLGTYRTRFIDQATRDGRRES